MNFLDFPPKNRLIIREILGDDFKIKPLKKFTVRIRKLYQQKKYKTPNPFLVHTNGNKKFKVLIGPNYLQDQFIKMNDIQNKIKKLDLCPDIIKIGDGFLIAEYLEGGFPNTDSDFAKKIGKIFADLHNIEYSKIGTKELVKNSISIAEKFFREIEIKKRIIRCLEEHTPENFFKGITYADHNLTNYISTNKSVKLIDFGSFQSDHPLDFGLLSSNLFLKIDEDLFWRSYLDNGGFKSIYESKLIMKLIGSLRGIEYNFQRFKDTPRFDFRLRNNRKMNVKNQIKNIEELIKVVDVK